MDAKIQFFFLSYVILAAESPYSVDSSHILSPPPINSNPPHASILSFIHHFVQTIQYFKKDEENGFAKMSGSDEPLIIANRKFVEKSLKIKPIPLLDKILIDPITCQQHIINE